MEIEMKNVFDSSLLMSLLPAQMAECAEINIRNILIPEDIGWKDISDNPVL